MQKSVNTGVVHTKPARKEELSDKDIKRLHGLLLYAYEVTEIEIWGENYVRMSLEEFTSLVEQGEIILAQIDNEIVGSIHVYPLSEDTFAFGLLSADFNKKGLGIGRALIASAEEHARSKGAQKMALEILKPRDFEVPVKNVLRDWYERLGYIFVEAMLFEERKPDKVDKAKLLKVPSVFDCYEKLL